ncbi:MAG: hypothetical protein KF905_13285 [Flavobacteriales bacterium]|nr:hypothetical protein [Flavobacteriales bacterium]
MNTGIFIFTRDSPRRVAKCLEGISATPHRRFVVDDSSEPQHRDEVKELCVTLGHEYLGGIEYERFLNERRISKADFSFLVREPGFPEWNLGFARNYALLKAHSIGLDRVLFMDDDIQVPAISLIDEFFQRVGSTSFVGAKVDGAVDLSLLGHIAAEAGMTNPEMLSGGFLAFNPATVTEHFVNVYNEDWIWLLLQVNRQNFTQHGSVIQDYTVSFPCFRADHN